ncbi:MAG: VCBS repeat-containing protein [Bacteroidota bacterium]
MKPSSVTWFQFSLFPVVCILLWGCSAQPEPGLGAYASVSFDRGPQLTRQYCQSCHMLPTPQQLPRGIWREHVLPKMGRLMGIPADIDGLPYPTEENSFNQQAFAQVPMLAEADWHEIVSYFLHESPIEVPTPSLPRISLDTTWFIPRAPVSGNYVPSTVMIQADAGKRQIWIGEEGGNRLLAFDSALHPVLRTSFPTPVGWIDPASNPKSILCMGDFRPSDQPRGALMEVPGSWGGRRKTLIPRLSRAVDVQRADINQDGLMDWVIAEFGNYAGKLAWYAQREDAEPEPHILLQKPGAIRTVIHDLTGEGLPDILALFGQGDEGVYLFRNPGNGPPQAELLLRFPPTHGSSDMALADMNGDGLEDLIIANGDNGDYPPFVKSHHGLRIYVQEDSFRFVEKWFWSMPGVGRIAISDLNLDSIPDIVASAFFPDFNQDTIRSLVWLTGGSPPLSFTAQTFELQPRGRWLCMDVQDWDQDGDPDIVLGNAMIFLEHVPEKLRASWRKQQSGPFLLLENTGQ